MRYTLTDAEHHALGDALRLAAAQYREDAAQNAQTSPRLVEQFEGQATRADALAERLDAADAVDLAT